QVRPELRTVKQIVALAGGHPEWEAYVDWRDGQTSADPRLETPGDDVAIQLYTSGTTRHPKGAQLTHDVLMVSMTAARRWYPCTADVVNLTSLAQFHYSGSVLGLISLFVGGRTVITRQVDTTEILRLIPAERVTHAFFAPAVLLFLLQTPGCRETD